MPAVFAALIGIDPVVAGSLTVTSPGTSAFSVPQFNTMTVYVWGGGAGGCVNIAGGNAGGTSSFGALLTATGGAAGVYNGAGGAGGTGTGGTTNETGGTGSTSNTKVAPPVTVTGGAAGGLADGGGATRSLTVSTAVNTVGLAGNAYGGGATGAVGVGSKSGTVNMGAGGGGGGFTKKVFTRADLTIGSSISITVGAGGAALTNGAVISGAGANGAVKIVWS